MDYEATAKLIDALARAGVATFTTADFSVTFPPKAPERELSQVSAAAKTELSPSGNIPAQSYTQSSTQTAPEPGTAGAAPPVEMEIPHQVNQVRSLLRLGDFELAERLFPDHTQPQPGTPGAKET